MSLKAYAGLALILLLGFAFWYVHNKSYQSGVNAERTKWQSQVVEAVDKRTEAEKVIVQERVVYRDRIQKIREVVTDCELPADLIGVLRESGVFTGR